MVSFGTQPLPIARVKLSICDVEFRGVCEIANGWVDHEVLRRVASEGGTFAGLHAHHAQKTFMMYFCPPQNNNNNASQPQIYVAGASTVGSNIALRVTKR